MNNFLSLIISLSSAVIGVLFQKYIDTKDFLFLGKTRKRALKGKWRGIVEQDNMNKYDIELIIKPGFKRVNITGTILNKEVKKGADNFIFKGAFKNERFLMLGYENADGGILQFGSMLLEFLPDSEHMQGRFVGYGYKSMQIIHGTLEIEKIAG